MTPQAGQVRDTQSTQAKDGHYKGKVSSPAATSCRSPPSSFNSTDTSPSHALCGALASTDHQGSAWGPRTLRPRRKTTRPPTAPTALLSLNPLRQLPQGREVQSDRAVEGAQEQKPAGLGPPTPPRHSELQTAMTILENKSAAGGLTLPDWGQRCRNPVWRWPKGRHTDQQNRTQSPETNLCIRAE